MQPLSAPFSPPRVLYGGFASLPITYAGGGGRAGFTDNNRSSDTEVKGFERHELWKGSVDFVAPKEYEKKVEKRRRSIEGAKGAETSSSRHAAASSSASNACNFSHPETSGRLASDSCPAGSSATSSFQMTREQLEAHDLRRFPCVVFVLDITAASLRSNLANSCIHALTELLRNLRGILKVQIALILYSDRLVFLPRKEESFIADSRGNGEGNVVGREASVVSGARRAGGEGVRKLQVGRASHG